jgi:DNA-binding NarL/FixJ family response regulator
MLTARGKDSEQIKGLQAGADDYIAKPCSAKLLVVRLELLFERGNPQENPDVSDLVTTMKLTEREAEVAKLAIRGYSTLNIAQKLNISEHTVHSHLKKVFRKLGVKNRAELTYKILAATGDSSS